jgi:hypothetical protein
MQVKSMACKSHKLFTHACVSTDDQNLDLQQAALEANAHAPRVSHRKVINAP